ncbi:MAG: VOC family protein [Synechococcales bacterium]|nr:VOC family protein [Synechococcales bacterium]
MQIQQFLHAAIVVSDLGRSEQFYGTVLGLTKVERNLKFPGAWYEIGGMQIHLIANQEFVALEPIAEKWGRNRHLAFRVADLVTVRQTLEQHGYEYQMSASGRPALFVQDPDGNILELGEG